MAGMAEDIRQGLLLAARRVPMDSEAEAAGDMPETIVPVMALPKTERKAAPAALPSACT